MGSFVVTDAEDGYENTATGTWFTHTAGVLPLAGFPTFQGGLRFQVHTTFDAQSRPLAPDILTSLSLRVSLTTISPAATLTVELVTLPAFAAFSQANRPSQVATADRVAVGFYTTPGLIPGVDTEIPIVLPTVGPTYAPHWVSPLWNGYLAFILKWGGVFDMNVAASEHATLNPARLTTTEVNFITGIEGHVKAMSRIDRCPRCGVLMPREKFVQDGYTQGLLVCPKCWDPVDPPTRPIPPDAPPIND